jgi:hypothetical protein
MVWVATTVTEDPASTQEGSEVNGFLEKVLLATDGLEHTALAARAAVDLAEKGDAKKSTSERRTYEAFALSFLIINFHCILAYRGLSTQIGGTSGA